MRLLSKTIAAFGSVLVAAAALGAEPRGLALNEKEYFSTRGLDVLVFSNTYDGLFSDAKIAGVELIHHGVRTATNGDVRLSPTPEQWDPTPAVKTRTVDRRTGAIDVRLHYPQHAFEYVIHAEPSSAGLSLRVVLDRPVPRELEARPASIWNSSRPPISRAPSSWIRAAVHCRCIRSVRRGATPKVRRRDYRSRKGTV